MKKAYCDNKRRFQLYWRHWLPPVLAAAGVYLLLGVHAREKRNDYQVNVMAGKPRFPGTRVLSIRGYPARGRVTFVTVENVSSTQLSCLR